MGDVWHDLPGEFYDAPPSAPLARTALGRRLQRFGWRVLERVAQDEEYPAEELSPWEAKRRREQRDGGVWGWYGSAAADDDYPVAEWEAEW